MVSRRTTVGAFSTLIGASPPIAARVGEAFAFAAELDLKRAQLAEVEVDLANGGDSADTDGLADDSRAAA